MNAYLFGEDVAGDAWGPGSLFDAAEKRRASLRNTPAREIIALLDEAGRRWADPSYPFRVQAIRQMPALTGFHPSMIEEEIRFLVDLLKRESLDKRIASELGSTAVLDDWAFHAPMGGYVRAEPLGAVVHIGAGNVFVGPLDSLIQGMITKNVNILKLSSDDPVFPVLFCRSLREIDRRGIISGAVAALPWKGGDGNIEPVVKSRAAAIVVYGGREAVESWRRDLGLHTRIVEYGPKFSLALVSRESFEEDDLADLAYRIALDASRWEQGACASPHVIYVEKDKRKGVNARRLMEELGRAFSRIEEELPQKALTVDEQVEITRVRELAKASRALGRGDLITGRSPWTVVVEDDPRYTISCLNRTVFIKEVKRLEEVASHLESMGGYLQTVAVAAHGSRRRALASALSFIGADRFTECGSMTRRIHGTPHDGVWSLQQLIRWSSLTGSSVSPDSDLLEALNALVSFATKHSPFYCEKFKDARIASLEDFRRLPLTTGDEMKRNTPPRNNRALTGNHGNGYVFTSGGTTGEPKFVLRTAAEQDRNATFLAKGLLAGGLKEGDTVANLLFSGNMWGSFVSFSRAVEKAGCRILPIGGNIPPEDILNYLNIFRVDAALAIPSVLLTLAQNAESRGLRLRIPLIFSGGEHIFSENLEYLKRVFEAGRLSSIGYATNDVGALGWQCTHLTGGLHHIHRDLHYVEILDPESLEPSPPGVPGKVVTTNLDRRLQPIIRYEVGDMGRWLDGPCPCGEPGPLFELLGRSDDILIIGGGNIYPEVIREAMAKVEGLSGFFSLRAQLRDRKDELIVRAEAKEDGADCALLAAALEKAVYASSKELNTMLGRGLINPVVVEVVPPGALPRNPRTGKIRLVEDGRI